jgi:hypothetical protein
MTRCTVITPDQKSDDRPLPPGGVHHPEQPQPKRPIGASARELENAKPMGHFDDLRTRINGLCRDASQDPGSPELVAAMEDVLSDGYITALLAEAEVRELRADLAQMRAHLLRLRSVRSA